MSRGPPSRPSLLIAVRGRRLLEAAGEVRRRHPPRHDLRRHRRAGEDRRRRDPRRSHRGDRRSRRRARARGGRRDRAGGRARLHQHAQPLGDVADRGRPRRRATLRQGVTLEVFGESSMGPLTEQMKKDQMERQGDIKFNIVWTTLGGYLDHLVARGISTNVASFVSAATVRANDIGLDNRAPTPEELERMRALVRVGDGRGRDGADHRADLHPRRLRQDRRADRARQGRVGVGRHVHLAHAQRRRSPARGDRRDADDRREAKIRAEIYHLKESGQIELEQARRGDREDRAARARRGSTSPPTCTTTPPASTGSTPRCRRGCRKAATRRGRSGCRIRRSATASAAR